MNQVPVQIITVEMNPEMMRAHAREAAILLKSIANESRLVLLCLLSQEERNVGELEALSGIRQPTLSQQLGVMRQEGLVSVRRDGKYMFYRLAETPAQEIMQTLWRIYCASATKDCDARG